MKRNIISSEFETVFQSTCVFVSNFILTYIQKQPSDVCYRRQKFISLHMTRHAEATVDAEVCE